MKRTLCSALLFLSSGCGDDDVLYQQPYQEYEDGDVTVIGAGDGEARVATGAQDGACIEVSGDICTPVERTGQYCKSDSGPVDVIVVDGQVRQVVCYEDSSGDGPEEVLKTDSGNVEVPQQENGSVVTFDESTDGQPIEGNITIDGNDVTLYGNGPDKSIIKGNLTITGNNARIRGIRVTGNVVMELNTAALLLSVVEGNLVIRSNNNLVAENDIFGNLVNDGNNTILVGNDVGQNFEGEGSGAVCQDNFSFDDSNEDQSVSPEERGDLIEC